MKILRKYHPECDLYFRTRYDDVSKVYLIHFEKPLKRKNGVKVQHYLGSTKNLTARLQQHKRGRVGIFKALRARRISWHVAQTWQAARSFESFLKKKKKSFTRICPSCHDLPFVQVVFILLAALCLLTGGVRAQAGIGPEQEATVLMDTEQSQDWVTTSNGVLRPVETINKTYVIQRIEQKAPGQAKAITRIEGLDNTTAVEIPETLSPEQIHAINSQIELNAANYQHKLRSEQVQHENSFWLKAIDAGKALILWGLVVSIPFLLTVYWIARNTFRAWVEHKKEVLEFRERELQEATKQIALTEEALKAGHKEGSV